MLLCALDIETTSLNPATGQILEIAAIAFEAPGSGPNLGVFHCFVGNDPIVGTLESLAFNAELLKEMVSESGVCRYSPWQVSRQFGQWLRSVVSTPITLCGKNVGSFDLQFLKRLPEWDKWVVGQDLGLSHRVLDIGTLFVESGDLEIPDLTECCRRAGVVSHRALADARMVVDLVRSKLI